MTTNPSDDPQIAVSGQQSDEHPPLEGGTSDRPRWALYVPYRTCPPDGLDSRTEAVRRAAAGSGADVVTVVQDDRPGGDAFQAMFSGASQDGIDHVVIHGFGVLGGQAAEVRSRLRELAAAGLTLVTADDGQRHDPAALDVTFRFLEIVAGYDAEGIARLQLDRRKEERGRRARLARDAADVLAQVEADWGPPDDDVPGEEDIDPRVR